MPVLDNPRHELFAQELAKGKSQLEAYTIAGFKPNEGHACRLASNGKVAARVEEILGKAAKRAEITIHDIAAQLDEDRQFARKLEVPGAAITATMGKAKVLGLLVDRTEHTGKDGGPIETLDMSPTETARQIAFALAKGVQPTSH